MFLFAQQQIAIFPSQIKDIKRNKKISIATSAIE